MSRSPLRKPATRATPAPRPQTGMALHTLDGARKYFTTGERDAFLRAAEQADRQVRTLCMTLAYAGCRLSEALALTVDRVDLAAGALVVESLKKRRTGIYRAVPQRRRYYSKHSIWCTASASCRVAAARDMASISGRGAA